MGTYCEQKKSIGKLLLRFVKITFHSVRYLASACLLNNCYDYKVAICVLKMRAFHCLIVDGSMFCGAKHK